MNKELKKLIKEICKQEGKKREVSIGNVREIIKIIRELIQKDPSLVLRGICK